MATLLKTLFVFLVIGYSTALLAESPFLDDNSASLTDDKSSAWHITTPTKPVTADTLLFPVASPLTQGSITTTHINLPHLEKPIFVLGDDEVSIAWAKQHAVQLKAAHAIGLLTNTQTEARWQAIQRIIGLTLIPVSLDGLNPLIPVSHYPFLLSQHWLEQ
ncbi:MAG: PFL_4695 family integrating conjugative element protein, partial [Gammaproteobacteria bacterium]